MREKITAIVAVTSEEIPKLGGCLASIEKITDEVVIFGLGIKETDLKLKGIKYSFVSNPVVSHIELLRNKMINEAKNNWVIILDPDERISPQLNKKIREVVFSDKFDAISIPRKNIFFGKWIRHSNWWPDRLVRVFKKSRVTWSGKIHSYPVVVGNTLELPADQKYSIIHYGYDNLGQFVRRQKRYALSEARYRVDEGKQASLVNLIWWPFRQLLVRYIKHMGFLDGFYGILLVIFMMKYEVDVWRLMRK
jgi:(heptosyl)LPS beta-1,4-glucosyltransferase